VKKSGAWYTYEGDQLGQGKENSRNFLISNPEIANEIEQKIKVKLGIIADPNAPAAGAGGAVAGNVDSLEDKIARRKGA
jgi:recombination protein RecA